MEELIINDNYVCIICFTQRTTYFICLKNGVSWPCHCRLSFNFLCSPCTKILIVLKIAENFFPNSIFIDHGQNCLDPVNRTKMVTSSAITMTNDCKISHTR